MDLWSWFYRLRLDDLHRTAGLMNLRSWFHWLRLDDLHRTSGLMDLWPGFYRLRFDDQRFGPDWLMNLNGSGRFVDRWPWFDWLDFRSDWFVYRLQWLYWLQFGADRFVYGVQWHGCESRTDRHVGGADREMPCRA